MPPSPGQLQGQVCTLWGPALAQALLPTIQKSLPRRTGFGQRSVVLQWSFCDSFGFDSSPKREKTVGFTWT